MGITLNLPWSVKQLTVLPCGFPSAPFTVTHGHFCVWEMDPSQALLEVSAPGAPPSALRGAWLAFPGSQSGTPTQRWGPGESGHPGIDGESWARKGITVFTGSLIAPRPLCKSRPLFLTRSL